MGKRSNFKRKERDFYPTPSSAVKALLPHLNSNTVFEEPCAGNGALIDHLEDAGHYCHYACDLTPLRGDIHTFDAMKIKRTMATDFITNPPWPLPNRRGEPTLSMALHLSNIRPTWMLLSSDVAHNVYFSQLAKRCVKIVSVGRVKWIPDSDGPGKDNCSWYLFDANHEGQTSFVARAA